MHRDKKCNVFLLSSAVEQNCSIVSCSSNTSTQFSSSPAFVSDRFPVGLAWTWRVSWEIDHNLHFKRRHANIHRKKIIEFGGKKKHVKVQWLCVCMCVESNSYWFTTPMNEKKNRIWEREKNKITHNFFFSFVVTSSQWCARLTMNKFFMHVIRGRTSKR